MEQDIIYVGGGNTKSMLALWREWKLDRILDQAYRNGTVLAGDWQVYEDVFETRFLGQQSPIR